MPYPSDPNRRCTAHTSAGAPCRKAAIRGGSVCATHGGSAPHVREAANQRLVALVEPALAELHRILKAKNVPDHVKLQAARDVLDRTGFVAKQVVEVTHIETTDLDHEIEQLLGQLPVAEQERRGASS